MVILLRVPSRPRPHSSVRDSGCREEVQVSLNPVTTNSLKLNGDG